MNLTTFGLILFFVLAVGATIYNQASFIKKLNKEKEKINNEPEKKEKIEITIQINKKLCWITYLTFFIFVPLMGFILHIFPVSKMPSYLRVIIMTIIAIVLILGSIPIFVLHNGNNTCDSGTTYERDFLDWIVNRVYNRRHKKKPKDNQDNNKS